MWGPSFRPDFLHITDLIRRMSNRPQVVALTATATPEIKQDIIQKLDLHDPITVTASFDRPELRFIVFNSKSKYDRISSRNDRLKLLLRILRASDHDKSSVIIYVTTTVESDLLSRRLQLLGYHARAYHGKMETADRESVQQMFMDDEINIVVCTKAFGMGIDKPDIRYVIHYNMPGDLESYYQEAGRAGRDGQPAWCVLLYHRSDARVHHFFREQSVPDPGNVNAFLDYLRNLPGHIVVLDVMKACGYLGIEETSLRQILHILEQDRYLIRGEDIPTKAVVNMFSNVDEVASKLESNSPGLATVWKAFASRVGLIPYRRQELNLADVALDTGLSLEDLDTALIRASASELVNYRPWEKGAVITKRQRLLSGGDYTPDEGEVASLTSRIEERLNLMQHYASSGPEAECRRGTILRYFGEEPETENCGKCDVCDPELRTPWSDSPSSDFTSPDAVFDVPFTCLGLAHWNADQNAPLGVRSLIHLLRGNEYQLTNNIQDPAARSSRAQRIRACPYFGVFGTLRKSEDHISGAFDRLQKEGYVSVETRSFEAHDGAVEYKTVVPTEAGMERIASGETFGWEEIT